MLLIILDAKKVVEVCRCQTKNIQQSPNSVCFCNILTHRICTPVQIILVLYSTTESQAQYLLALLL